MTTITEENAPVEFQKARFVLRMTSMNTALIFSIILIEITYIAIHQQSIFGSSMIILILLLSFTPIIVYFLKSKFSHKTRGQS